ncbi:type I restriction enzyme HsdR N-terminal domain-containing protein [Granulosicoccus antarcticus]|uniref:Type I restriction enzyme R protein N-terminal domain-containing protein n=1 Tax=Granulosicoccus antarcticus IMCC3135 TaxID=1192854 RepID=A0A2Z2NS93_9GAMM|nr:type I restriction enzyme HsdR N-terminal domain-containing protein [Granulosicoccus antarcticus]ASJ74416.1 hypothetical protein IMCC3135_21695 [Granulosicoccus antarcticus IMCC3135]
MDIADKLRELAETAKASRERLGTEEATKNALVMPFIMNILEYNVFDPKVVIPEFVADVGNRKGEKVDYAILNSEQEVIFLVECKRIGDNLSLKHAQQLIRYFHTSSARIGVLTNGVNYEFYSDLDKPNIMDDKPFLEFDITKLRSHVIPEIKKMCRGKFDLDTVLSSANELKYTNLIIKSLKAQFEKPDDDVVKLIAGRVQDGAYTQKVREQFTPLVFKAMQRFLTNVVDERIASALSSSSSRSDSIETDIEVAHANPPDNDDGIVTTQDEIDGYNVVKAIARQKVAVERVVMRDTKSYCGILLDDNNRKPICRLRFNNESKMVLGLFDQDKAETRHSIDSVDDIYKFSGRILATLRSYASSPDFSDTETVEPN